jgi:predicted permease
MSVLQDLKFAVRMLAKSPAFSVVAVLTLALGIGANTSTFSVMNAAILRYLPVHNPQKLVYLYTSSRPNGAWQTGDGGFSFNEPSYERLRQERGVFSDLMAFVPLGFGKVSVRYGDQAEEAFGDMVSGSFFSGLGVKPVAGRIFTPQDEAQHTLVTVLSYGYWTRRFARNPDVIGKTLYIRGVPFTIVGVAARDFRGVESGVATDVWVPLQNRPDVTAWGQPAQEESLYGTPHWWCLMMIGRLAPGISEKQALAELEPAFLQSAYAGPVTHDPKEAPPKITFIPARGLGGEHDEVVKPLSILMAMVGLVLLIACCNVALMLVARNASRAREFSVRLALGAGRSQLFRQLLAESLLLVSAGAAVGWVFALWSTQALVSWAEMDVNVAPDNRVLGFTLLVSAVAALAFGLAPLGGALRSRPGATLKTSAAVSQQEKRQLRTGRLVMGFQVALCLVVLVAAGLLVRTLHNLQNANLGMRAEGLVVFGITPPQTLHTDPEILLFDQRLTDRLRSLPGVQSVTLTSNRPGSGWSNNTAAFVDGRKPEWKGFPLMRWNSVGPDFFHTLRIPLLLGRDFTDADTASAEKVVVVNQVFVDRYLPGRSALGHHVSFAIEAGNPTYTIVGVAANSRYTGVREPDLPIAYFPYTQTRGQGTMHFELRTTESLAALLPQARTAVREFGPDLPLLEPRTLAAQFDKSFSQERMFARLSLFFGLLAALLVATGLYGTLTYRVGHRTPEIGVRMAMGAQQGQVLWMVLRESLLITFLGILAGLPLAVGGARVLRSMLFGLTPADPLTFILALLGMALVVLLASYVPARQATKVDPLVALRYE